MSASIWRITRGVKPADTILRSRLCSGASMLIIEPKNSRNSAGRSGIEVAPAADEKVLGLPLAVTMSACRVTA